MGAGSGNLLYSPRVVVGDAFVSRPLYSPVTGKLLYSGVSVPTDTFPDRVFLIIANFPAYQDGPGATIDLNRVYPMRLKRIENISGGQEAYYDLCFNTDTIWDEDGLVVETYHLSVVLYKAVPGNFYGVRVQGWSDPSNDQNNWFQIREPQPGGGFATMIFPVWALWQKYITSTHSGKLHYDTGWWTTEINPGVTLMYGGRMPLPTAFGFTELGTLYYHDGSLISNGILSASSTPGSITYEHDYAESPFHVGPTDAVAPTWPLAGNIYEWYVENPDRFFDTGPSVWYTQHDGIVYGKVVN